MTEPLVGASPHTPDLTDPLLYGVKPGGVVYGVWFFEVVRSGREGLKGKFGSRLLGRDGLASG